MTRFPNAVLTGTAAARLTFWPRAPAGPLTFANVHTTTALAGCGFSQHRPHPQDVLTRQWLRLTRPARTALDLAVHTDARSIDEVLRTRQATLSELWETWSRSPQRPGNRAISELLRDSRDQPWSGSERLCHRTLRSAGITGWVTNHPVVVGDQLYYLDVAFKDVQLYLEVDGAHHRDDERTFQSDRVRQNALMCAAWTPLRFTGAGLESDPERLTRQVRQLRTRLRRGTKG